MIEYYLGEFLLDLYQFSLGDLTFTIRKLNRLTQVDYSKKLGVVQSTISKVEKGIFHDVPFSLISKISTEFNIPLSYFQIGLLPLRKTQNITKIIKNNYINDGLFQAKTIFYLLNEVDKNYKGDLYKDLKLPKQYLCLSHLTYNLEFIDKVYFLTQDNLLTSLAKLNKEFSTKNTDFDSNIYYYLTKIHNINTITKEKTFLSTGVLKFNFSIEINELNEIYAQLLKFELQILFDSKIDISNSENSNIFEIKTYAMSN